MAYELLLPSRRVTPADAMRYATAAEERGWTGLWCSEVLALDTLVMLGAVGARTQRLRIGTAIVPISTRSAALLAMAAATLEGIAPGRFVLGLGVSTPKIVADRHGRPVTEPLAEARGVLEVVTKALRGELINRDRNPKIAELRIEAPETPPVVGLAALGPKMTQVALEAAEAIFLNLTTFEEAERIATTATEARGRDFETFLIVRTAVEPTEAQREAARREVQGYAQVPVYRAYLERLGVLAEDWGQSPDDAIDDAALDALTVIGDEAHCRARLDAFLSAGVTPLVVPVGEAQDVDRTIAIFGDR